jgi:hypothetical protein
VRTDHEAASAHGDQLALEGLGPVAGEPYKHKFTGTIATVVAVRQRDRCWVTLRRDGRLTDVPLDWLEASYEHCRI